MGKSLYIAEKPSVAQEFAKALKMDMRSYNGYREGEGAVVTSVSYTHLQAMQDAVDEALYKNGVHAKQVEGNQHSTWILMDYGDIIVHIFSKEDRLFYDLERIWRDGTVMEPDDL